MLRAAIFDLDGVIVNTVPLHFKAWKKMFEEYGHAFNFDDYLARVDGIPRKAGARAILTDISVDELQKACDKKQVYFLEFLNSEPIDIFESSVKLVNQMKAEGIKLGSASSSKNANKILKRIGLFDTFNVHISGGDLKHGKPDPEIFLSAAEKLGLKPSECIVFEDARLGVEAAVNGKFPCIGINRHDNAEALSGADKIVNDLAEISLADIKSLVEERK